MQKGYRIYRDPNYRCWIELDRELRFASLRIGSLYAGLDGKGKRLWRPFIHWWPVYTWGKKR